MDQATNKSVTATSHGLFWFWVIMVSVTLLFGLYNGPNSPHFWLWWEVGSLVTATIYTFVFYVNLFVRDDNSGQRVFKGIDTLVAVVPLLCAGAVICLLLATIVTICTSVGAWPQFTDFLATFCWRFNKNILPLIFLVLSGVFFCALDLLFWKKHSNEEVRREFCRGFLFNAVPVTLAFAFLLVFVARFYEFPGWHTPLKSFIGGAVAFEMILSNTTFAILFWKPREV